MTGQTQLVVDDQGFPLIPHENLWFIDHAEERFGGVVWNPPAGYFDGLRYGRDVALAILRVAPEGIRTRSDDVGCLAGDFMIELQFENGIPKNGSGASAAIHAFWDALLHFIFVSPTHQNVEAFRAKTEGSRCHSEISLLRAQLSRARRKPSKPRKAVRR